MNDLSRITIDPEICHGKPTIRGLRYPVSMILELLASDMTPSEILADYEDPAGRHPGMPAICRPLE